MVAQAGRQIIEEGARAGNGVCWVECAASQGTRLGRALTFRVGGFRKAWRFIPRGIPEHRFRPRTRALRGSYRLRPRYTFLRFLPRLRRRIAASTGASSASVAGSGTSLPFSTPSIHKSEGAILSVAFTTPKYNV